MKLSILDQMPVPVGSNSQVAFGNSVELAQHVDRLGYHRLWYSEHHDMEHIISSSPEIMLAYIASVTKTIRIGSGGVMIPNHTPYKLAEDFKTLALMAPGRIDLGIGRSIGGGGACCSSFKRRQSHFA